MNFLREYKKLNYYGQLIGIKRKFFETNQSYKKRLMNNFKYMNQSLNCSGSLAVLTNVLDMFGFKVYKIQSDYENCQIKLILKIY